MERLADLFKRFRDCVLECARACSSELHVDCFEAVDQIGDLTARMGAAGRRAEMCAATERSVVVDQAFRCRGIEQGATAVRLVVEALRPLARNALAATSASPFVRYGVRPVSLK